MHEDKEDDESFKLHKQGNLQQRKLKEKNPQNRKIKGEK